LVVRPPSMIAHAIKDYQELSLAARMAIALLCFERYCQAKGLRHPSIATFLDHMWELPCSRSFPDWESRNCELVHVGLGEAFPCEILELLTSVGVSEQEFRELLGCTVEIVYGSAYAKSDDTGSLQFLDRVFRITSSAGVLPPPVAPFLISLFADGHGWGAVLSSKQRDGWRFEAYDNRVV